MMVSSMLCTKIRKDCVIAPVNPSDRVLANIRATFGKKEDGSEDAVGPCINRDYLGIPDAVAQWARDHTTN
jgi:hypothetical protein